MEKEQNSKSYNSLIWIASLSVVVAGIYNFYNFAINHKRDNVISFFQIPFRFPFVIALVIISFSCVNAGESLIKNKNKKKAYFVRLLGIAALVLAFMTF